MFLRPGGGGDGKSDEGVFRNSAQQARFPIMEMPPRFLRSPQARAFGLFGFPFLIFRLQTAVLFFDGLQVLCELGLIAGTFFLPLLRLLDSQKAGFVLPPRLLDLVQQAAAGCRVREACPPVGGTPIAQEFRQGLPAQDDRSFRTGRFPILSFPEGKCVHMRFGRLLLPDQCHLDGTFLFSPRFGQLTQLSAGVLYGGQVLDKPLIRRRMLQSGKHLHKVGSDIGQLHVQALMGRLHGGKGASSLGRFPLEGGQGRLFFKELGVMLPRGASYSRTLLAFPFALFQRCPD